MTAASSSRLTAIAANTDNAIKVCWVQALRDLDSVQLHIYLSLTADNALATKHPMAWLACILLLLTSTNRLII